eukprot:72859-Chlamydomonas_euryale.AAC.8
MVVCSSVVFASVGAEKHQVMANATLATLYKKGRQRQARKSTNFSHTWLSSGMLAQKCSTTVHA